MLSYIIKLVTLVVFWGFTVFSYYNIFPFHAEAFPISVIFTYFMPIICIYTIYKLLSYYVFNDWRKDEIEVRYISILWYGLFHLLTLCIIYFTMKEWFSWLKWIWLFIKIIWFLLLPTTIFSVSYWIWNKVLSYIKWFEKEESIFRFLSSLGLGFYLFIVTLYILALVWLYNIYSILIILVILTWLSYKNIAILYFDFIKNKITVKKDINLYTSEFLFIILTALISINLILVFRPFPIWWDDLWVYMNIPRLIAAAWSQIGFWWINSWEIYTWIWFLFGSSTQAFYLNTFSGILAASIIFLFTKSFFKEKNEFINIPLLLTTIFISMPMVIFQLWKDMKLDIWLFSISIIWLYMIYYLFINKEEFVWDEGKSLESNNSKLSWFLWKILDKVFKKEYFKKEDLYYIFIIWIIIWFAFTVKLTSIMLISSIIWLIIFNRIWFNAFLWYLFIYFAIFTKLHLWSYMNVSYPKNDIIFINWFSWICFLTWIIFLAIAYIKHNKEFILKTLQIIWIFILWISISIIPWLTKNIIETWISNISIWSILWWKQQTYNLDYKKILSENELNNITQKISQKQTIDNNWQAADADMWRYFWYERWINNYLKLPYNLSMQTNQRWEYTDITYIFFALLPVLFLFIPLRNKKYYIWIYLLLLIEVLYYLLPSTWIALTNIINNIELPLWYAIIFWFFISLFLYFKSTTERKKDIKLKLFIINLVICVFYVFLWNIAAYWIVWYWISMYMCFLIFIWIWIHYITKENKEIDDNDTLYILKNISFFAVFIIISIYFVRSSIPHIFANVNEDSYMHYKAWILKEDEAIFAYHWDYLNILFELNISEDKKLEFITNYKKSIYDFFSQNNYPKEFRDIVEQVNDINKLNELLNFFIYNPEIWTNMKPQVYSNMKKILWQIRNNMYKNLVNPVNELKSKAIIYRMWTFLKYFVTENNYRLVEDSLLFSFDYYIHKEDINKTIDNFKKLWIEYIILDLNTPTIDKEPTHTLTIRFENLLKTLTSQRLKIVDTDSLCLRTAIELYNKTNKTTEDLNNYLRLAWVNYESYDKDNNEIWRTTKLIKCYDVMFYLFDNNLVNTTNLSYLMQINDEYKKQNFANQDDKYKFMLWKVPQWFKAVFKIEK